jgi:ubiquinone/menaquinone biosynthesis C-methylase UbiE
MTSQTLNQKTIDAYRLYSKYYAFIALLTYWIIWRGNLRRHIRFYRESLHYSRKVVDIATGDGTLTQVALFARGQEQAEHVTAVDISDDMRTEFLKADVEQLPFGDCSQDLLTCFGGLNSFASGQRALSELNRIVSSNGVVRGSFLLMPKAEWKRKLVRRWIEQGYQTCELSVGLFENWCAHAKLDITQMEQHGDVVLFELVKAK